MVRTARKDRLRENKKNGSIAAKEWGQTASFAQQINLAGCDFEYGETLDDLRSDGFDVPPSSDADFSWGFYKQVKSCVFYAMYRLRSVDGTSRQIR